MKIRFLRIGFLVSKIVVLFPYQKMFSNPKFSKRFMVTVTSFKNLTETLQSQDCP